jgi:tripartite-type tricarboxylate transporter receptor subunit TctC
MIDRRTACAALALAPLAAARAETFPDRPIRMVVGFAPGGGADSVARLLGPYLSKELGQPIVVDNKPGVGGNIAARHVASEVKADGYTIMMATIAALSINPHIYKDKLGFDPERGFAPITNVVDSCNILVVQRNAVWRDVAQLVATGKTRPLSYGSSGTGTAGHLAGVMFGALTGTQMLHVPYKSGGALMTAILSGEVDMSFASGVTAVPQIQGDKLRGLGVTTLRRIPVLPDIPTMEQAGVPNFVSNNWHGLVAPAGTPRPVIDRLNAACAKVLRNREVVAKLHAQALDPAPMTPEAFATFMRFERAKWGKLIRDTGLKVEI